MSRDVLDQADDALAEMCWCGHSYTNHTDGDTPTCFWPHEPDSDAFDWQGRLCTCDGWYPMNEDTPEGSGGIRPHDWIPVTVTLHGRKRYGRHCRHCHIRAVCPHGCGLLHWADDSWICPKCGDEWFDEETFGQCEVGRP